MTLLTDTVPPKPRRRRSTPAAAPASQQLLARLARDIQAPLGAVAGFAQQMALDRHDPLGDRHRRWASLIEEAARHMLQLLGDAVAAPPARALPRRLGTAVAPLKAFPVMRDVLGWMQAVASRAGVTLQAEPGNAAVRADPRALRQVLLNLVSNAIKYNRPGGSVALYLVPGIAPGRVAIVVQDTGCGLSAAMRERLFQPYDRLGRERSGIEGTGLGLCIVRQRVDDMGGTLEVESTPGIGSVFRVVLPQA